MKIELQFVTDPHDSEDLAFTFWKRDIKTVSDKKKIVSMIHHLHRMWCIDSSLDTDDLDEVLSESEYSRVGFVVRINPETGNPGLYIYDANKTI